MPDHVAPTSKPEIVKPDQFYVEWRDAGRELTQAPNPEYPDGVDVTLEHAVQGVAHCVAQLPYPAKRCGYYIVRCKLCDYSLALTTTGRRDDPRSVTMMCALREEGKV